MAAEPMQPCGELNYPTPVGAKSLDAALRRATKWAQQNYGEDCVVCAEPFGEDERTFGVHVTSPDLDGEMVMNTSALLTFRQSNGHLIRAAKYHSCFVKRHVAGKDGA